MAGRMAPPPQHQHISGTSATHGAQAFAGTVHGNVYYGTTGDDPLKALTVAEDAPFYARKREHDPSCLDGTRVELLDKIYTWADNDDGPSIFWLNGWAGTGKSTIARTVARTLSKPERRRLGASFFFARGGGDVGRADRFVTTIARQLCTSIPPLQQHVRDAIKEHGDIAGRALREQWQQLVLTPLSKLDGSSSQQSYILVIDALDECDNDDDIRLILQLLGDIESSGRVRLRTFLTSRPEVPVRSAIRELPDKGHVDLILHEISSSTVNQDILLFFSRNFDDIRKQSYLDDDWPGEDIIRTLVKIASGLFIWAATACLFVRKGKHLAAERLSQILSGSKNTSTTPEGHLNEIYMTVLKNSVSPDFDEEEKDEFCSMLRLVLGSVATLFSQLSVKTLSLLLGLKEKRVNQTMNDLQSILHVPEDHSHGLRLHHPSFRDFLFDSNRCTDSNFCVEEGQAHRIVTEKCIEVMSICLKQDVCSLDAPSVLAADIERGRIEGCLPPEVQYACLYWVQHLQKSNLHLDDNDQVHVFLQKHLLYWLEALGWMGRVSEAIHAVKTLESMTTVLNRSQLSTFIYDVKLFILRHRYIITLAPLQIYYSALMFSPESSIVRYQFKGSASQWVQTFPVTEKKWNAWVQTLEGHSGLVTSVAFSHDSKLLASASGDKTVRVWDAGSGEGLRTLEGHSAWVTSVAFSHDSKLLASASGDKTVRVWDAGSGEGLRTLEGHSDVVSSVAFSHDSKLLASASDDETVRVWDAGSGACLRTLSIGRILYNISFDTTDSVLHTEIGALEIDARLTSEFTLGRVEPQDAQYHGVSLSQGGEWISYDSKDLIWLPFEYRPSSSAVSGNTIGVGTRSGMVWMCRLGH